MERENFKKIIKLRSFWKIDRRKGNYKLPNGEYLADYVRRLVESQMKLDNLGIASNGDFYFATGGKWNTETKEFDDYTIMPPFEDNEICSYDDMKYRINALIHEIVH